MSLTSPPEKGGHLADEPAPLHHTDRPKLRLGVCILLYFFCQLVYVEPWSWRSHPKHCPASIVDQVLREVPLIDGHDDFPSAIRYLFGNHINGKNFTNEKTLLGQVDFPRLRAGRLGGQFWSVYVDCPPDPGLFPDALYFQGVRETIQQIDLVKRLIDAFPDNLAAARTAADIRANYKHSPLRISSLMGVEGLHQIGNSPALLRLYYDLGVRYTTLTHYCHNQYADSSGPDPLWGGLSEDGKKMVKEMNRMGMTVDLAHTSVDTSLQALEITEAPVMFSHTGIYSICPNRRNVPDEVLLKLKENGGVVMIDFVPTHIKCTNPENSTLSDVADHIEYAGKLIGYEHIGIGADYDGMGPPPEGLEDVSTYPALLEELVRRGVTKHQLKGIVGGNVLRVLEGVEETSRKMVDVLPYEDDVEPKWP